MFSGFVNAQNTGAPDWINYSVFVENGLIFFVGHSEFRGMLRVTLNRARINAQNNLIEKIKDNELSELPSIPPGAESRSTFSDITNDRKVEGTISDISLLEIWEDDDGGVYVLCSCTGVELKQEDNDQEKSLEDMDPMELYLYSLELEKQATEGANE
jgi:hypothetical protein